MNAALPEVGQYVWHPSLLHVTHGVDDFQGGVCKVSAIVEKPEGIYVRLEELGDWEVSWKYLLEGQDEWRERYGKQPGRPDPDFRREFNELQPNASVLRRPGRERTREERSM